MQELSNIEFEEVSGGVNGKDGGCIPDPFKGKIGSSTSVTTSQTGSN